MNAKNTPIEPQKSRQETPQALFEDASPVQSANMEGALRIFNAVIDRALFDYAYGRQAFLGGGCDCLASASFFLFGKGPGSLEGLCLAAGLGLDVGRVRQRAVGMRGREKERLRAKKRGYLKKRWECYGRFRRAVREGREAWIFPKHVTAA